MGAIPGTGPSDAAPAVFEREPGDACQLRRGFEEEIAEIFRLIIPKGIGIELNTNRGNTPLPDEKWLRLYRSLGGEIVTLGTDAHTPGFVGCAVREGQALLRACGFRRFAAFRQGKPVWHEL